MELPEGVEEAWDLERAYREATGTRERVCINGLWRWRPAGEGQEAVPEGGWGYLRVPESWPSSGGRDHQRVFFPDPAWGDEAYMDATAAWQQREVTIPEGWTGRRITLHAEYINSFAAVYLDGEKVGEMCYPWGDVDLTTACSPGSTHVLTMLVVAMPLQAVMMSHSDSASARQVRGSVARKGLCGDVYLVSEPDGPAIADLRVSTLVRTWQITFDAKLKGLDPDARYALRARISDDGRQVAEFTSRPFQGRDLSGGRVVVTERWRPEKLWDTHTPQNQYDLSMTLVDADEQALDEALPSRFGFREFWIEGRDFYLNGTRIYLSAIPLDNGQMAPPMASYEGTRGTLQRFKSFGINFVYTHNYGCEPGAHLNFEEVLRAADDEGMLLSFSQPHFGHYEWDALDADLTNGYAGHAAFYAHAAGNHPSVVCYSTSHNATGYAEDMNPDMIDGIQSTRQIWSLRNVSRARRAEEIICKVDPTRFVYHHASGDLGTMHLSNFYANWAPIQEMSDWFAHWATMGVKPVFTCEYSVPFMWDWAMYRGWYKGKREFGSAVAPWEFCVAEWNAQFLGDGAYRITEEERENLRWEAEQFRAGRAWQRYDYPHNLNTQVFEDRYRVVAMHLTDNWRAFRTWGMSANSPWDYQGYWIREDRFSRSGPALEGEVDWGALQRPGPRPAYVDEESIRSQLAFDPDAHRATATLAAEPLYRNNMPLLAYVGGKADAFTSKDHNFLPGETFEKQLIVINNSREPVTCDCRWSLGLPDAIAGRRELALPTGRQERLPLTFELPADLPPGRYELSAAVEFSTGETQEDAFALDVLPQPQPAEPGPKVALFDPQGESASLLKNLGIECSAVAADADFASYDVLVIGKGALTPGRPAPDVSAVRAGLKVIVFEQTGDALQKRFGFRTAEYGLRWVFKRVPDHPVLAGIEDAHLWNWRGSATLLSERLDYEMAPEFNYSPAVKWCGITVTRAWRCGNRGNVASALIEKPACGNFLPILEGGYALQYTSLMECRDGKGMVLFCQTDVTGRTEPDPAAEALVRNIFRYVSKWEPAPVRQAVYVGEPAGKAHLEAAGLSVGSYPGGSLPGDRVLIVGPGGGQQLAPHAVAIADWLEAGGHILAVGLTGEEASSFLPFQVRTDSAEHIAAHFGPFGAGSALAGISPADAMNRDPRELSLVTDGATPVGNGVLATAADERVVFCQLAPWQFDYRGEKMNVKRTFRRVSCLLSRALANMGVWGRTPLLDHMSRPAHESESRWLDGLYLDVPEEWDDPYRLFRW